MEKKLLVYMPDGSVWSIPIDIIAHNRAAHFADEYGGDIEKSLSEDTKPLFDADAYAIEDWARNNMNWTDVKHSAWPRYYAHLEKLASTAALGFG